MRNLAPRMGAEFQAAEIKASAIFLSGADVRQDQFFFPGRRLRSKDYALEERLLKAPIQPLGFLAQLPNNTFTHCLKRAIILREIHF